MKQVISVLLFATLLACAVGFVLLSAAVDTAVPTMLDAAPGIVEEIRRTDTLDEIQQFEELERPSRPVWPFVLAIVVVVGMFTMVAGTPFLKQANSLLRQFKRRGGGARPSTAPPAQPPIVLPPGYGQQALLPPPSGDEVDQW
jgi:hypothetical protein